MRMWNSVIGNAQYARSDVEDGKAIVENTNVQNTIGLSWH